MVIGTHAYNTLRSTSPEKMRYDQYAKEFLADVQILARIMQHTVAEVQGFSIEEIIECIDKRSIEIEATSVDPGYTNLGKVSGENVEDSILNEGMVVFDIKYSFLCKGMLHKVIINVEAQKSTDYKKLGYHLESRIVYYLSRLISSQKGVEFERSDYDNIKKVYSIWICMDAGDDHEGITQFSLCPKTLFGTSEKYEHLDKMCGIIVHIRQNANVAESKNQLIAMLEDAFAKTDLETKRNALQNKHGIKMTMEIEGRVNGMCNLSDVVEERGIEQGIAQGIEQGIEQGVRENSISIAKKMFARGSSLEEVSSIIENLSEEELRTICDEIKLTIEQ